jgi:hypothetical protein
MAWVPRRVLAVALVGAAVALGCTERTAPQPAPEPVEEGPAVTAPAPGGTTVVVVLPPADVLDLAHAVGIEGELAATGEQTEVDIREVRILTPPSDDFRADLVTTFAERSAELVCVLGQGADAVVLPLVALHPTTTMCAIAGGALVDQTDGGDGVLRAEVRLEELGRLVGVAARRAAGPAGAVGLILEGDEMATSRWQQGLLAGLNGVQVLRAQDAEGPVDLGAQVDALVAAGADVVVFDGHVGASEAAERAVAAGVRVLGPAAIVAAGNPGLVASWEVRWSVAVAAVADVALAPPAQGATPSPSPSLGLADGIFELTLGPAASPGLGQDVASIRSAIEDGVLDPVAPAPPSDEEGDPAAGGSPAVDRPDPLTQPPDA